MNRINYISFPGIGIGEMKIDKIAFEVFGRPIAWYGIIITIGIILAVLYVINRGKYEGVSQDDIIDYSIFVIPIAIIGARLYYVLTSLDQYDSLLEMFAIWEGGLAIYGAVIGGALTALVVSKIKKIKILKMFDMLVPAVMIGQIIGRWGNFMNAEAHGGVTDIFIRMGIRTQYMDAPVYVHPTFLYESLWNLAGFLGLHYLSKKPQYDGQIALSYAAWYGLGRCMIEGLRTDSLYWGPFRVSQLLAAVSCFAATAVLLYMNLKAHDRANLWGNMVAAKAAEKAATEAETEETPEAESDTAPESEA